MSRDDDPQQLLGDALWHALGEGDAPELPEGFDAGFRARLAEEQGREALGDPLWEALGAVPEVPAPAWQRPANRPAPSWRTAVAIAAVVAATFLVVPQLRRATAPPVGPPPPITLALARDLELAEHLDLLSHPDFELLVAWDGEAP